jgi:hypothetical protein
VERIRSIQGVWFPPISIPVPQGGGRGGRACGLYQRQAATHALPVTFRHSPGRGAKCSKNSGRGRGGCRRRLRAGGMRGRGGGGGAAVCAICGSICESESVAIKGANLACSVFVHVHVLVPLVTFLAFRWGVGEGGKIGDFFAHALPGGWRGLVSVRVLSYGWASAKRNQQREQLSIAKLDGRESEKPGRGGLLWCLSSASGWNVPLANELREDAGEVCFWMWTKRPHVRKELRRGGTLGGPWLVWR